MLKKKERLTKKEFDCSFFSGKRYSHSFLQVIHHSSNDFRGSVVVGKKIYKKAVDRNRLRRRLYGVLYRCHKKHNLTGTFILIAKPKLKDLPNDIFINEIETLLKKIHN